MKTSYSYIYLLLTAMILVCGCRQDKPAVKKTADSQTRKAAQLKPDSSKYVLGPLMPKAACCKGFPSRAKALAAKR